MNYAALVAAVQNYCETTFATADMNTFITQAETRIYNAVQFPALRKTVSLTATISSPYVDCPVDFLAAHSVAVIDPVTGAYSFLLNKDSNFMREAYPTPTVVSIPKYYALYGPATDVKELKFIVGPTPDKAYTAEVQYFYYPESITTVVGGQTWLGDNFDPVLLYGTLVEAYTFMKGEQDMMTAYDNKFKEALLIAKRLGEGMERQDSYRSGLMKTQVS